MTTSGRLMVIVRSISLPKQWNFLSIDTTKGGFMNPEIIIEFLNALIIWGCIVGVCIVGLGAVKAYFKIRR